MSHTPARGKCLSGESPMKNRAILAALLTLGTVLATPAQASETVTVDTEPITGEYLDFDTMLTYDYDASMSILTPTGETASSTSLHAKIDVMPRGAGTCQSAYCVDAEGLSVGNHCYTVKVQDDPDGQPPGPIRSYGPYCGGGLGLVSRLDYFLAVGTGGVGGVAYGWLYLDGTQIGYDSSFYSG